MSWNSKVLWTEGLFLQPHHFQQHDRYFERLIDQKAAVLQPYPWGIHALSINADLLALGKVAIAEARGILPDGTPFNIPDDDPPPDPLQLDENVKEQTVYREKNGDRPSLAVGPAGEVGVKGGVTGDEMEVPYEEREFRKLSERPPGMPIPAVGAR